MARFDYRMRFSKTGRARFIAHLDTLASLVRAVRRAGFQLAFTEGMRPKPVLSLAMPLGVGVEGEEEICDFSLAGRASLTELAKAIGGELPGGMELRSVGPSYERSKAAARVTGASYRIELDGQPQHLEKSVRAYNGIDSVILIRRRPKGDKEVDIKKYVDKVSGAGAGIVFDMEVTAQGTGRPEEVLEALSGLGGGSLVPRRIIRTGISLREEPAHRRRGRPPRRR